MGELERRNAQRETLGTLQSAVLGTVAAGGLSGIAAVAPGALILLKDMGVTLGKRHPESIRRATNSLVKKGYLVWKGGTVHLTPKGQSVHALQEMALHLKSKKRRWDGKWRVLVFDIPERRRSSRLRIRAELARIGFVRMQDSVWVYPYECEEFIALLKAELSIGKDLLYMIVDSIEGDQTLRSHFALPRR